MKTLFRFTAVLLAISTAGCVGADARYYQEVPVSTAEQAPVAPMAAAAPVAPAAPIVTPPSAATYTTTTATTTTTVVASGTASTTSANPLDQLVAPVALYPDPLLALLLPASVASSDIVLAARYLAASGDPQQVDAQPWDESVRGLARYPDVIKWMDENLAWTQQLGAAYLDNAEEVMAAVQRVRAEARAKGLLVDTPQQQVVVDSNTIAIVPAQQDIIYVPRYDPEIIFVDRPIIYSTDPWLTFGVGFGVGWWLSYDCDWHHRRIWVDRHSRDRWRDRHEWRQPIYVGGGGKPRPGLEPWRPAPNRPRPVRRDIDRHHEPRPTPMPGTPHRDHPRVDRDDRRDREHRPDRDQRRDSPNRPSVGRDAPRAPDAVRHFRPVDNRGRVVNPAQPANNSPTPQVRHDRPNRDAPRVEQRPQPPSRPAVDRTPPAAAPRTSLPRESRPPTATPPRESRGGEPRVDRGSRPEPSATRSAPPPARTPHNADNPNRSRDVQPEK